MRTYVHFCCSQNFDKVPKRRGEGDRQRDQQFDRRTVREGRGASQCDFIGLNQNYVRFLILSRKKVRLEVLFVLTFAVCFQEIVNGGQEKVATHHK